jgi:hypothetical protein
VCSSGTIWRRRRTARKRAPLGGAATDIARHTTARALAHNLPLRRKKSALFPSSAPVNYMRHFLPMLFPAAWVDRKHAALIARENRVNFFYCIPLDLKQLLGHQNSFRNSAPREERIQVSASPKPEQVLIAFLNKQ